MPLPADLRAPNHVSQTILEAPLTEYPSPRSPRHRSTSGHSLPFTCTVHEHLRYWRLLCTAQVASVNKTCSRWPGWGTRFAARDSFLEAQRSWCGGLQLRTQSCKWWKRVPPVRRGTRFAARSCGGLVFGSVAGAVGCSYEPNLVNGGNESLPSGGGLVSRGVAAGDSFWKRLVAAAVGCSYEPNLVNGGNESLPSGGGLVSRRA